jgi:tetratricopeptide (TPR) repeat protein
MIRVLLIGLVLLIALQTKGQFKFYEQGLDAYQKKDYANSIVLLNEYLDRPVRDKALDVDVRYWLALSYFKTQSYTAAIREFDESLTLGHKNIDNIHWFMAKSYVELKAFSEGISEYTKAIEAVKDKPNQAKLFYERALVYDKIGNRPLAMEDISVASSADATNPEIRKTMKEWQAGSTNTVIAETKVPENKPSEKTDRGTVPKADKSQIQTPAPPLVALSVAAGEPSLAEQFKDEKRYALVIGNSHYKNVAPLKNSVNDANDIAAELINSKFEVIKVLDGSYEQMRDAYKRFHEKLSAGPKDQTVGLFYYAGHGIQNEGENYLVPVEANIQYEDDIPRTCLPVQRIIMANMERSSSRMNIVILDACRNNPFPSAFRSTEAGLAEIKRAKGSFIAYATAPGYTASDGEGRNGLYTQELLKAMRKPGITIEQVFKEVRRNVLKLSGDRQYTWDSSNIIGDFYFKLP